MTTKTTTTRIPRGRKLKQQFSHMYLRLQITIPLTVDFLPFPPSRLKARTSLDKILLTFLLK